MKAVAGAKGKVLQVRGFLQNDLRLQECPGRYIGRTGRVFDKNFKRYYKRLMIGPRLNKYNNFIVLLETNSVDEASSIAWNFTLIARWEGIDWGLTLIQQHLWPLLQEWSSGQGLDPGAASAILCIGNIILKLILVSKISINDCRVQD